MNQKRKRVFKPSGPFSESEILLFRKVANVLAEFGIKHWIDQGTLLGVYRSGTILPWDKDIDLGVWDRDISEHVEGFKQRLKGEDVLVFCNKNVIKVISKSAGFHSIDIARYMFSEGMAIKTLKMPRSRKTVFGLFNWIITLIWIKTGSKLIRGKQKNKNQCQNSDFRKPIACDDENIVKRRMNIFSEQINNILTNGLQKDCVMMVRADYFLNLRPAEIEDIKTAVPANTDDYLSLKYGTDWKTPKKQWKFWEEDGAIK